MHREGRVVASRAVAMKYFNNTRIIADLSKEHQGLQSKWEEKEKDKQKKKEPLAGARTHVLKLKMAPKQFNRRPVEKKKKKYRIMNGTYTRDTRHQHAARPNLDDDVPQRCPCTGNPELRRAVPFSNIPYV